MEISIIGLDTSHAPAFTGLLNNPAAPHHVPGGKVVVAFPGGSPDFGLSRERVGPFTKKLKEEFGVKMAGSPAEAAEAVDAVLLLSADGRIHLPQFAEIAAFGKPVFIDKPLAASSVEARRIAELSAKYGTPVMSSSALRFSACMKRAAGGGRQAGILGADCFGPVDFVPTQPGLFWYGIHAAEMLYTAMGPGVEKVRAASTGEAEFVTAVWKDGRIGTLRGDRGGGGPFGALIHRQEGAELFTVGDGDRPFYADLLEEVIGFFHDRKPRVPFAETLEIIRFLEAANESRETGREVTL